MLPDFIIIGTQKGGTSSLFYYLKEHPQMQMPQEKEIHYFDLNYNKGLKWYESHFPNQGVSGNLITGEASPYYLFHPLAPERAFSICPKVKLIALLRNPVDRAYSHYAMERKKGNDQHSSFEIAIEAEEARLKGEAERIISESNYNSYNHQKFSYLERGKYSVQIKRWLNYFPCHQCLFIKSENFFSNPQSELRKVYDFLGVETVYPHDLTAHNSNAYDLMSDGLRTRLEAYFTEEENSLIEMLGDDFNW